MFVGMGFTLRMLTPLVFARLTEILPLRKAAPAVAVVSGVGTFIGQFIGPLLVGHACTMSDDYRLSLILIAACAICGGIVILLFKTAGEREKDGACDTPIPTPSKASQ